MGESTGRTVAKNASWLMLSQLLTWGMSLLLTILLSRHLGAEGIGKFFLANSLWAIASIFASFGMDVLLIKEIARHPEKTSVLFSTSLVLRTLLFGVAAIGMAVYVEHAGYPLETAYVIAIVGLTSLISQYSMSVDSVLRGLERMEYISIGNVALRALLVLAGIPMLALGHGAIFYVSASVVTSFIHLLLMLFFVNRVHTIRFSFERSTVYWMLKSSYTYFFVYIFLVLYAQIDTVVISLLVNEKTIGWYAAADQLFATLLFIPTVFITAVFPAMSRMHEQASVSGSKVLSKGFDMLLLLGIPIGLGVMVIAGPIVTLLFGNEFTESGPVLAIRGIVLILTYQNILMGQYYISIDKPHFWTWVMIVATLATIPLDLVLVPWSVTAFGNGAIGGALAYVVTELGMMIVGLAYLPKGTFGWDKLWLAGRNVTAGLLMAGVVWLVRDYFIAIPIVVGVIVYLVFIRLFHIVPAEDLALIKQVSQGVLGRFRNPQPASSQTL